MSTLAAAGGQVGKFAIDPAGTIYCDDPAGLWMLPSGGTAALLIRYTNGNVVLGSNPRLPFVSAITVQGPKQIVIVSAGQILLATLP